MLSGLARRVATLLLQDAPDRKVIPIGKFSAVPGIVMAFVFLHETVTAKTLIGCALITIEPFVLIL